METTSVQARESEHEKGGSNSPKSPEYLAHLTEEAEKIAMEVQILFNPFRAMLLRSCMVTSSVKLP